MSLETSTDKPTKPTERLAQTSTTPQRTPEKRESTTSTETPEKRESNPLSLGVPESKGFRYVYPDSFGNEDRLDHSGKSQPYGNQSDIDKTILKRLSQVNRENTLTFKSLLKKIRMEMQHHLDLANNSIKDSLSARLHKSSLYPASQGTLLKTVESPYGNGTREITAKLAMVAYSDIHSKKESTHYTLDLTGKQYIEQCMKVPQCKDCVSNGSYSLCSNRTIQPHKQDLGRIPLSKYWQYMLVP